MDETESQGPMVNAVAIAFAIITAIAITLRLWARAFIVKKVGADDGLILVAALLSWAFMIVTIIAVDRGLGMHFPVVLRRGMGNLTEYLQAVWLSSIFYNACLGFIKISVLALYMRLGDRMLRQLAMIMIGVVSCQAGGNVLAALFQCSPVRGAYDVTLTAADKTCINVNAFYLANAAVNIFTDLLTYTLPIRLVTRLQVPRRQKMGLAVILCLGLFACISSIIRITFVPALLVDDSDATWVISPAMYWSVIEINVGILAASIPSLKPLASRYAPRLLGGSYYYDRDSGYPRKTGGGGTGGGVYGPSSGRHPRSRPGPGPGSVQLRSRDPPPPPALSSSSPPPKRHYRAGPAGVPDKFAFDTHIERGLAGDNSSEEVLCTPNNINVRTQIETRYDERL